MRRLPFSPTLKLSSCVLRTSPKAIADIGIIAFDQMGIFLADEVSLSRKRFGESIPIVAIKYAPGIANFPDRPFGCFKITIPGNRCDNLIGIAINDPNNP